MRLLLDTHVVLWAVSDDPRVGPKTREMLDSPDHVRVVSAATIWEVEIKIAIGKLAVDEDLRIVLANSTVEPLQISSFHAQTAGRLPLHHGDPFDRMLVAHAGCEGLTLMTSDRAIAAYDVAMIDPAL